MGASKECKKAGLKGVTELSETLQEPRTKMYDWFHDKKKLFYCVLIGAVIIKILEEKSIEEIFEWLGELKKDESNG